MSFRRLGINQGVENFTTRDKVKIEWKFCGFASPQNWRGRAKIHTHKSHSACLATPTGPQQRLRSHNVTIDATLFVPCVWQSKHRARHAQKGAVSTQPALHSSRVVSRNKCTQSAMSRPGGGECTHAALNIITHTPTRRD